MTRKISIRTPAQRQIETALEHTGLPWSIQPGSKHRKIYLCGHMIGVFSYDRGSTSGKRGLANIFAVIKRSARTYAA